MQAALVDESILEARRRLGHDRKDEMWKGVLYMVPPPSWDHQRFSGRLLSLLVPLADSLGLEAAQDAGTFHADDSYRVPDIVVSAAEHLSSRGNEGRAALVVEVRSPGDQSFDKLPSFAEMGIAEVVFVDRDSKDVRRWVLDGPQLVEVEPDGEGWHHLSALPIAIRAEDGQLAVRIDGEVRLLR